MLKKTKISGMAGGGFNASGKQVEREESFQKYSMLFIVNSR